ncbi:MAG TPA: DNA translocase FtsK 4TM domain-containing protein, partial [Solirubrobacterales bacterium]|nr:DNA translocase FtsK 4TM domain-containing protein [Solirubrobacterales bacterium]
MQRRLDLAGLCCIGLAVYLGYVLYLGWNGGAVGNGSETALDYAVGAGAVVVPVAFGLAGIGLILRPFLPSPKSVAVGVTAIAAGLLLALAAQTAGFGPDGVRKGLFDPGFFPHHGGGIGEVLYWATSTLFDRIGAHIIAIVLLVSGILMLTGRSVSDMVRAARRGAERAKRGTVGFATAVKESRINTDPDLIDTTPADTEPVFGPPEPIEDGEDIHVHAGDEAETAKVANFDDAVRIADEPDTSELEDLEEAGAETIRVAKPDAPEPQPAAGEAENQPAKLTPMGQKRGGVTESEEIDYVTPDAEAVLERGAPDKGPDKQDHEAIARNLLEALGHFGVEAKIVGTV